VKADVAAHFERLGFTGEDAAARARLVDRVDDGFRRAVGGPAAWRWFVPGRIEIFGKHTDYAGGRSLLAAVPRGMVVAARPREDHVIRAVDVVSRETATVRLDVEGELQRGWARYLQVVARRLQFNFAGARLGLDLAIGSDLPRAAGLSSSSALVVGVAAALARRADLTARVEWRQHIPTAQALASYLGSVENGLDYPGLPGTAGVGTHGGSEDHSAILTCRSGHVSQYRFVPVTHLGDVPMPDDWRFVVATSGVHADKAGSVRDQYNRASLGTRALCEIWNRRASTPAASLAAALASAADALDELRDWVRGGERTDAFASSDLLVRLEHFVSEDARVPEAAAAFGSADAHGLSQLSAESQQDADDRLGNQVHETRTLTACAREAGAFAASSFGAGFGGSVWALVGTADARTVMHRWVRAYRERVPSATIDSFVAWPGPSLTELPEA
jgi:galactokinase